MHLLFIFGFVRMTPGIAQCVRILFLETYLVFLYSADLIQVSIMKSGLYFLCPLMAGTVVGVYMVFVLLIL